MRERVSRDEGRRYLEIGLTAAGPEDSEERARLLVASSFAPDSFREPQPDDAELERAIATGEEAAAMAQRLGRVDLESAALDGITSAHQSLGRYMPMEGLSGDASSSLRNSRTRTRSVTSTRWQRGGPSVPADTGSRRIRPVADIRRRCPGRPSKACTAWTSVRLRGSGSETGTACSRTSRSLRRSWVTGRIAARLRPHASRDRRFRARCEGRRATASRYLRLVRWLEQAEDRLDTVLTLWQAHARAARRFADARALLQRPEVTEDRRGQDEILEAWCEVVSEEGTWVEAAEIVDRTTRHADWASEPPLALFATRLEGRAAAAAGEPDRAAELLRRATDGFAGLDATWEAAVTRLDLAHTLLGADRSAAQLLARDAVQVFDRLGSARELKIAGELLARPG